MTGFVNQLGGMVEAEARRSRPVVIESLAKLVVADAFPVRARPEDVAAGPAWGWGWPERDADDEPSRPSLSFGGVGGPVADRRTPWSGSPRYVLVRRQAITVVPSTIPVVVKRPKGWTRPEPRVALLEAAVGGPSACLADDELLSAAYHVAVEDGLDLRVAQRLVDIVNLLILARIGCPGFALWSLPNPPPHPEIIYPTPKEK